MTDLGQNSKKTDPGCSGETNTDATPHSHLWKWEEVERSTDTVGLLF